MKPKQINQINPKTGEIIKVFPSITEAAKEVGIHKANISCALRKKCKTSAGYKWEYSKEEYKFDINQYGGSPKPIKQINTDTGELIAIFPSVAQAARKYNIASSWIAQVARKKTKHKTAGGYKWEYCEEK